MFRFILLFAVFAIFQPAFAQVHMSKWPMRGGFQMEFEGTTLTMKEKKSGISAFNKQTALCDSMGNLLLSSDGLYVYDHLGNKLSDSTMVPRAWQSNLVQIVPHLEKKNTFILFLSLRENTGVIYELEIKRGKDRWQLGQVDTLFHLPNYGQQLLLDTLHHCYQLVCYDPTFVLHSIKRCPCGTDTVYTDLLSDSVVENQGLSWFPQVMRFSKDQGKVAIEAPQWDNIPELLVVGDYNMQTGKVSNRLVITKKEAQVLGISDIWDMEFSPDNRYLYIADNETARHTQSINQLDLFTKEVRLVSHTPDRRYETLKYFELGLDGKLYVTETSSNVHSVLNIWCVPNPNAADARVELVYQNWDKKTYPGSIFPEMPDFPPFLYWKNYRFPTPVEVPTPQVELEGGGCFTTAALLRNKALSGVDSTRWQVWKNGKQLSQLTGESIVLDTLSPGIYTIEATNYTRCIDSEIGRVSFEPDSFPQIQLNTDSVLLCTQLENQQPVLAKHNTAGTAQWNTGQQGDTVVFLQAGTYVATVANACGTASDTLVQVQEEVSIPNIITPNGDGKNDTFIIELSNGSTAQIEVFNRWGASVFNSENYSNNWPEKPMHSGIYYYHAHTLSGCNYSGWVNVMSNE